MLPQWLKVEANQLSLQVKIKPGSRQNALSFDEAGGLQISLQAAAQDGKANKMLIQYLSKLLKIPQKQIILHRGATSRIKTLWIKVQETEQQRILQVIEQIKFKP